MRERSGSLRDREADRAGSLATLGVNEGTLGNGVQRARESRDGSSRLSNDDYAELLLLRGENAELRMERDVLVGRVERRTRAGRSGRLVMS